MLHWHTCCLLWQVSLTHCSSQSSAWCVSMFFLLQLLAAVRMCMATECAWPQMIRNETSNSIHSHRIFSHIDCVDGHQIKVWVLRILNVDQNNMAKVDGAHKKALCILELKQHVEKNLKQSWQPAFCVFELSHYSIRKVFIWTVCMFELSCYSIRKVFI